MAEIDAVANWQSEQVINWFRGLDDGLHCYVPNLEEASITGAQLLALNYEDLSNLGILPIGHQELVLEATELLKQLHFGLDTENLQSRALDLNCRCRALRSSIFSRGRYDNGPDEPEGLQRGSGMQMLRLACDVLDSSKLLVMWLDRPPFINNPETRRVRANIVKLSYELSTTVQQSVFACVIEEAVSSICSEMEASSNQLIVSSDPMTIQPSSLEVAHLVNRDSSAGLGLFIKATFEGHHVITGTKEGSISSRIRRIAPGDEVVAVGGQTVVGWQLSKLVGSLKESPNDISLTLKKRPHFSTNPSSVLPTSRRPHQDRILTVPPPISPIRKIADSRKNSVEDVIDGADISRGPSQEYFASPKKGDGKKKRKLKKQKAKSSSNILATAAESTKKPGSNSQRNSVNSFGSSFDGSLRSASSAEGALSVSMGNLTKNFDIRRSLEKVLKRDRAESPESTFHQSKQKHYSEPQRALKERNTKHIIKHHQDNNPKVMDLLEELRSKRLKQRESSRLASHDGVCGKNESPGSDTRKNEKEVTTQEPPSSPLDFLIIPPPPQLPYTPRAENILQILDEEASNPAHKSSTENASESPNSLLDIEHRRRFTVIGSEQMDEKWYNSLLSEVNSKRSKRIKKSSARQVLEKVDETTASEDSVFISRISFGNEDSVVRRPPKPKLRHRPVSMPPNYYSPANLNQLRATQVSDVLQSKNKLSTAVNADHTLPLRGTRVSPVAHQFDENGVKKLAPLNYSLENVTPSATQSSNNRFVSSLPKSSNSNNNNSVGEVQRNQFKIPPKPPLRTTPVKFNGVEICPVSSIPAKKTMPSGKSVERLPVKVKPERPKSANDEPYVGLLRIKPADSSTPEALIPVKRHRSRTEVAETETPERQAIADELSQYFLRKRGETSASSNPFSPSGIPSPAWTTNNAFTPTTNVISAQSPTKKPAPLIPPVAKPRNKIKSLQSNDVVSPTSPPPVFDEFIKTAPQRNARKNRSKSMDSSEVLGAVKSKQSGRVKTEGTLATPERSLSNLSRASHTSRGSYVAAMDDGYTLENMKMLGSGSQKRSGYGDSDKVKVIDGVRVRLRKNPSKSSTGTKKKGRLKIIDQLKGSADMRSQRRISCRDLGEGECNGWLWKKKTNGSSPLSSKWIKRWVVLKNGALYCYHTEEDDKAESYISLPGYQVTPTSESKRKFAFRVAHPLRKTFFFASDRQMDMSRWMNKMGLAAIEYGFSPNRTETPSKLVQQPKGDDYYSESESEDAFMSHSESSTHNSNTESSTPNSSPEKPVKVPAVLPWRNNVSTSRHVSTQPDLNRSARFPKNKAQQIKQATVGSSAATQTTDLLQRNSRNRSKSEAAISSKASPKRNDVEGLRVSPSSVSLNIQDMQNTSPGSCSPSTSPRKKPAVSADQRKHKADGKRRKQFLETSHLSNSLELIHTLSPEGVKPAHSEEELQHLRRVAVKKAEEVAKRKNRLSASSLTSNQSAENLRASDNGGLYVKNKKSKPMKAPNASPGKIASKSQGDAGDASPKYSTVEQTNPSLARRDIAGRPKVKADAIQDQTQNDAVEKENSSIDDLCKALHNAEVDIHGVNRRATLRRKMTILSRDPKKNELMLKKRALQRQIKAFEAELEYYKLLDTKAVTSETIHEWINQHPSLVAELGTIRRMSKKGKKPEGISNDQNLTHISKTPGENNETGSPLSRTSETTRDLQEDLNFSVPVPAKRSLKSPEKNLVVGLSSAEQDTKLRKVSNPCGQSTLEQKETLTLEFPKVRPRSCAISNSDLDRIKPRSKTPSPSKESSPRFSPARKAYLETDL